MGGHPLFSQIEKRSEGGRVLMLLRGKPPPSAPVLFLPSPFEIYVPPPGRLPCTPSGLDDCMSPARLCRGKVYILRLLGRRATTRARAAILRGLSRYIRFSCSLLETVEGNGGWSRGGFAPHVRLMMSCCVRVRGSLWAGLLVTRLAARGRG